MSEFELSVRACLADPDLTYRQRVQALALLAENALPPPVVSEDCTRAQAKAVVHDMGEGNAPYRPRYVLPDYATALARGSAHLELKPGLQMVFSKRFLEDVQKRLHPKRRLISF